MSKHLPGNAVLFAVLLAAALVVRSVGQDIDARIKIQAGSLHRAEVSGHYAANRSRHFAIQREFAGLGGLGERLSSLSLEDAAGQPVAFRQFISGEFVADGDFVSWRYSMDLSPHASRSADAHISWLAGDEAILHLADLLPVFANDRNALSAKVRLELPEGWTAAGGRTVIETHDVGREVIFIGKGRRERQMSIGDTSILTAVSGEWKFSDAELSAFVDEIYTEYRKVFGAGPSRHVSIYVVRFPRHSETNRWEADTRGSTVTIVSSDMPFRTQSLQRLHEQLRHELFHLWMPNGVNLSGNYDWFYEGFALYQSLKLGVALNRLRFDDFLDTLARAYTIDALGSDRRSLIGASAARVKGADTQIYARGMLVAFLTDLALLRNSGGKTGIAATLQKIFQTYRHPAAPTEGNKAVLEIIALPQIARTVTGDDPIDWKADLDSAGIEAIEQNSVVRLRVISKPDGRQRKMLDRLGYNNWRKLPITVK